MLLFTNTYFLSLWIWTLLSACPLYKLYVAADILSDATRYLFVATDDISVVIYELSDATDI